jgi:hypothetical protein
MSAIGMGRPEQENKRRKRHCDKRRKNDGDSEEFDNQRCVFNLVSGLGDIARGKHRQTKAGASGENCRQ